MQGPKSSPHTLLTPPHSVNWPSSAGTCAAFLPVQYDGQIGKTMDSKLRANLLIWASNAQLCGLMEHEPCPYTPAPNFALVPASSALPN